MSTTNSTAPASGGATQAGPAPANNARALLAANTLLTEQQISYGLLIFYGIIFFLFIPIVLRFFQSRSLRWSQGWKLRRGYDRSSKARPRADSSLTIHARYLYNKTLLRDIPFLHWTFGQTIVCGVYLGFVLWGMLGNGGYPDAFTTTNPKRSGAVSLIQLPFVLLFGSKNTVAGLMGKGHEKLNVFHRWGGLLCIITGVIHSSLYFKKIGSNYSFSDVTYGSGTVCLAAFGLIYLTSLKPVRTYCYQLFLYCHIIGWLTFIVALNYHDASVRNVTYATVAIYGLDLLIRLFKTQVQAAKVTALPGNMVKIEFPKIGDGWRAGQHVWLRTTNLRFHESHPFTIANAPSSCSPFQEKEGLQLLIKGTGDFTNSLVRIANPTGQEPNAIAQIPPLSRAPTEKSGHGGWDEKKTLGHANSHVIEVQDGLIVRERNSVDVPFIVQGPYGGMMYNDAAEKESVMIVVGGSGISFGMAVLEDLVHNIESGAARTKNITFVWTVRDFSAISWVQDRLAGIGYLAKKSPRLDLKIEIYVTGKGTSIPYTSIDSCMIYPVRPKFDQILLELVNNTGSPGERGGGVLVAVCGPRGLVSGSKAAVRSIDNTKFLKSGGIIFHSETFGW